jgi:hypothetical protein
MLLLGEEAPMSTTHQQVFWSHCPECREASKHHLLKFGSFSYWFDNLGFITEGRLAVVLITPSLGVPNWSVIYINTAPSTSFLASLPGRKNTSARGVSHAQSFTLFLVLLYFIFACIFYQKYKKN